MPLPLLPRLPLLTWLLRVMYAKIWTGLRNTAPRNPPEEEDDDDDDEDAAGN